MEISFLMILVCAVVSIILGSLWYGPILFGKAWMRLNKVDPECMKDPVKRKEMQKQAMPAYILQLVLSIVQIYILAMFVSMGTNALATSLLVWLGFLMPMAAQGSMWNSDTKKNNQARFLVVAGFNLVLSILLGLIIGAWM
jgi:Protein of unknown function (DUF1761)